MTNIELGMNLTTPGYYSPQSPYKDLIKHGGFGRVISGGVTISGVDFDGPTYVPSSFTAFASSTLPGDNQLYVGASSDENGWPLSVDFSGLQSWQKVISYLCIHDMPSGTMSAVLPPSSADDPTQATFHVLWDGSGYGGNRGWRVRFQEHGPGSFYDATITDVSAGEAKITGVDTNIIQSLWFDIIDLNPDDHVRNVRIVHQDYRDNFESEPFFPQFIDFHSGITTSGGPLRFMKKIVTNTSYYGRLRSLGTSSIDYELSSTLNPSTTPQAGGMNYGSQIQYANKVGRDAWINILPHVDDASISAIASMVANELEPGRKVYIELGNEWWNFNYPYNLQETLFAEKAEELGGSAVFNLSGYAEGIDPDSYQVAQAYAVMRSIDIFKIFENYLDLSSMVRVLAGQFVAFSETENWSRNTGMLMFSSAYDYVDMFCINDYVGSLLGNNVANAEHITSSAWTVDDLFDFMYSAVSSTTNAPVGNGNTAQTIRQSATTMANALQAKSELSGIAMGSYEGGHHLDVGGGMSTSASEYMEALFESFKADSRLNHWIRYLLSSLDDLGFALHTHFDDVGVGDFASTPHIGQQTPYRSGLETFASGQEPQPDPPPDPPVTVRVNQVGYRISNNRYNAPLD
jgi:hypothetical protein